MTRRFKVNRSKAYMVAALGDEFDYSQLSREQRQALEAVAPNFLDGVPDGQEEDQDLPDQPNQSH